MNLRATPPASPFDQDARDSYAHPARSIAWLAPLLAMLLVAGIYAAASWNNQFVYDDHEVIENLSPPQNLHDLAALFARPHYLNYIYYRPLTRITFALQRLGGLNPRPYHLFNAILAGLVTGAAWLLLRRPQLRTAPAWAVIASILFGLHPAMSECVYPAASGRESLMPMLFILLSLWAYLHDGARWIVLAMLMFIAALLCKEQAAVLPGLFVLADVLWPRCEARHAQWKIRIALWTPVVLVMLGYFILRHIILRGQSIHLSVQKHPLEPFAAMLYGIQTSVLPFLELRYEPPMRVWFNWPMAIVSVAIFALLIWKCLRRGALLRRPMIFWIGWFVLLQLPTAHLLAEQEAPFSERYVALAALALAGMLGAIAGNLRSRRAMELAYGLAPILLVTFALMTAYRGTFYASEREWIMQWIKADPDTVNGHVGLGRLMQLEKDDRGAAEQYRAVLQLDPTNRSALNNLGDILQRSGDFEGAAAHFKAALSADPADITAMIGMGDALSASALANHDDTARDTARVWLEKAVQTSPTSATAHYHLGLWQEVFGDKSIARQEYEQSLRYAPGRKDVRERLEKLK